MQEEFLKALGKEVEKVQARLERGIITQMVGEHAIKQARKTKPKSEKESFYENQIWDFLEGMGWFPIKFENQATFDPTAFKRRAFNGKKKRRGVSDLIFFCGGKAVFCEVKAPERLAYILRNWDKILAHIPKPRVKGTKAKYDQKKNYQEQIRFIQSIQERGQIGFFADGVQSLCANLIKFPHLLTPQELEVCSRLAAMP